MLRMRSHVHWTCVDLYVLYVMESVKSFVRHCTTSSTSLRKRLLEDLGAAAQSGGVRRVVECK